MLQKDDYNRIDKIKKKMKKIEEKNNMRSLKEGLKYYLRGEMIDYGMPNAYVSSAELSRNDNEPMYPICGSILNGA